MSTQPLRIIFMGTPDFAAATLKALIDGPDEVVAVVTQPDRAKGREKNSPLLRLRFLPRKPISRYSNQPKSRRKNSAMDCSHISLI